MRATKCSVFTLTNCVISGKFGGAPPFSFVFSMSLVSSSQSRCCNFSTYLMSFFDPTENYQHPHTRTFHAQLHSLSTCHADRHALPTATLTSTQRHTAKKHVTPLHVTQPPHHSHSLMSLSLCHRGRVSQLSMSCTWRTDTILETFHQKRTATRITIWFAFLQRQPEELQSRGKTHGPYMCQYFLCLSVKADNSQP